MDSLQNLPSQVSSRLEFTLTRLAENWEHFKLPAIPYKSPDEMKQVCDVAK